MIPIWPILKALLPTFGLLLFVVLLKIVIEEIQYRFFYQEKTSEGFKHKSTPEATKLSEELTKLGYKAELEKWDGYKHIDIAVVQAKINIEIDGSYHNYRANAALKDLQRTFYSLEKGYVTIRIPNSLVRHKLFETVSYLDKILKLRITAN